MAFQKTSILKVKQIVMRNNFDRQDMTVHICLSQNISMRFSLICKGNLLIKIKGNYQSD